MYKRLLYIPSVSGIETDRLCSASKKLYFLKYISAKHSRNVHKGMYFIFLDKSAAILYHGLSPVEGSPASLCHCVILCPCGGRLL
jgi:hypothetical protein